MLTFPYLSSLWVGHCTATRRVEGGYPKYQRWPGALKMRRGDFHESCVAGAGGCCQAPPSNTPHPISASALPCPGQVLSSNTALVPACAALQLGETADKRSRKNVFLLSLHSCVYRYIFDICELSTFPNQLSQHRHRLNYYLTQQHFT